MRVKISTNPPLPPVRAWFPLTPPSAQGHASTPTISSFKSLLCASLPAFRGVSPSSLCLSIDGFDLLDNSELTVVRDGDLICVDVLDVPPEDATVPLGRAVDQGASRAPQTRLEPAASRKRKRRMSTPSSSSSESDTESTTSTSASESESDPETETSDSESTSDSDDLSRPTTPSLRKAEPPKIHARERPQVTRAVQPKPHVVLDSTFVPPGYGKPQTRSRNLRRRLKRMHEHEAADMFEGQPVSGANAAVPGEKLITPAVPMASREVHTIPALMSLSLRNKNKAKNFKSLIGRPLPPKIIFGDEDGEGSASTSGVMATPEWATPAVGLSKSQTPCTQPPPRLIPPSSRSSLPPNLFVTSIDVEAGLHREKKKRKMRVEYGDELEGPIEIVSAESGENISLDYGDADQLMVPGSESEVDIARLESVADKHWATLEKPTSEKQVMPGMIVGYKALGINPETYTPEQLLTLGRVLSCDSNSVAVRPLRVRERVSFSGPVDDDIGEAAAEGHTWDEILHGDWRILKI